MVLKRDVTVIDTKERSSVDYSAEEFSRALIVWLTYMGDHLLAQIFRRFHHHCRQT